MGCRSRASLKCRPGRGDLNRSTVSAAVAAIINCVKPKLMKEPSLLVCAQLFELAL
jgi:hypothetical protein